MKHEMATVIKPVIAGSTGLTATIMGHLQIINVAVACLVGVASLIYIIAKTVQVVIDIRKG